MSKEPIKDNPLLFFPSDLLIEWFELNKRSFPWREYPTPYRVWVSEVMLQQTQAKVVIPYFERWFLAFPTIHDLAEAPLEKVIKLWEGLGYYSRARNLHEAAKKIVAEFKGEIPSDAAELAKIKGLGPYTIGAIRSFAFKQREAAVDGNVMRVLSRFMALEEPIDQLKTQKKIRSYAAEILPDKQPWMVTEGLIELGALVCKKDPDCLLCPIRQACQGRRRGLEKSLPFKLKKQTVTVLHRFVGVIECQGRLLLKKGDKGKVMSDLYEFPYLDLVESSFSEKEQISCLSKSLGLPLSFCKRLPKQEHGFTRFHVHLYPILLSASELQTGPFEWIPLQHLHQYPFSSGHKRIVLSLELS